MGFQLLFLLALLLGNTLAASAQKFPFPQHVNYASGSIEPAVAQATMDQAVQNFYDARKARHLVQGCQSNHVYVYYSLEFKPEYIAYALLLADRQWGSGGEINYLGEARKVIAAPMKGSINTNAWTVRLGDWTETERQRDAEVGFHAGDRAEVWQIV